MSVWRGAGAAAILLLSGATGTAEAQLQSSKLSSGVIVQGSGFNSPKLSAGIVLQNGALEAPKLSSGAVVQGAAFQVTKISVGIVVQTVPSNGIVIRAPLTHW